MIENPDHGKGTPVLFFFSIIIQCYILFYSSGERYRVGQSQKISLEIKPTSNTGLLLSSSSDKDYIVLEMDRGKVSSNERGVITNKTDVITSALVFTPWNTSVITPFCNPQFKYMFSYIHSRRNGSVCQMLYIRTPVCLPWPQQNCHRFPLKRTSLIPTLCNSENGQ